MKTIKINVPLTVQYEILPTPIDGEAPQKRIGAKWGAVSVTISGSPEAVDHMLSVCPVNDPPTLIQHALSTLGYVVGDHAKDVEQFSRWVDHLAAFRQSDDVLDLWTGAVLARLSAKWTVDAAVEDAQMVVAQRMRLFPPVPKTGLDDGPEIPKHIAEAYYAELQEWRSSANQRGWASPLDMRGRTAADDAELGEWRSSASAFDIHSPKELASLTDVLLGELLDRKRRVELRNATGCETLDDVAELIRNLRAEAAEKHPLIAAIQDATVVPTSDEENANLDEIAKSSRWLTDEEFKKSLPVWGQVPNTGEVVFAVSRSTLDQMSKKNQALWQEATGCPDPATAKERIKQLRAGYDSADTERSQLKRDAEQRERAWVNATDRHCPGDAEQRIDDLRMQVKMQAEAIRAWQKATKCKSPEDVGKLDELAKTWQDSSTRYEYVAKQRAREISEWVAKSGVASPDELVEKFRVTEEAWKEATGTNDPHAAYKKISGIENKSTELASEVRAWQKASGLKQPEQLINATGISQTSWREATGCPDALQAQRKIAELESKLLSYASEIDALRKSTKFPEVEVELDHGTPLTANGKIIGVAHNPERELAKVRAELQSKCREAQTAKERADENAREMVNRGALLDKIAEALGCDFSHDSLPEHVADLKREHDNVNDSLVGPDDLANETKEIASILVSQIKDAGIESAAGAIASRSVYLSASWAKTMQAREILGAKPGEDVVSAAKRVMEKLTSAIIPLPKPEKIEAGQKWAFVMTARPSANHVCMSEFVDASGENYLAGFDDIDSGFYLGK